jgi:hypothetical protein
MADAITPAAPAPGSAPVTTPAVAPAEPSKTLLTSGDPPVDPPKPGEPDPGKPPEPAKVVPEKYDFTALKLPEGLTLDESIVKAIEPVFKELGLTQEQANKLTMTHATALHAATTAAETKREADFQQFMKDSTTQNIAAITKEWGNDFKPNLAIAQKGLARMFPDAAGQRLLDETGLGNHPAFLKAFLAVGKMISEDTPPNGQAAPMGSKPPEAVLYGNTH